MFSGNNQRQLEDISTPELKARYSKLLINRDYLLQIDSLNELIKTALVNNLPTNSYLHQRADIYLKLALTEEAKHDYRSILTTENLDIGAAANLARSYLIERDPNGFIQFSDTISSSDTRFSNLKNVIRLISELEKKTSDSNPSEEDFIKLSYLYKLLNLELIAIEVLEKGIERIENHSRLKNQLLTYR